MVLKLPGIYLFLFLSVFEASAQAAELNTKMEIAKRCTPVQEVLYTRDFQWGYSLPDLLFKFNEIYNSPKRLSRSAYFDVSKGRIQLPYDLDQGGPVLIEESFVQTVAHHIEQAFSAKTIDAVFFPDMGHSHLLIPEKLMVEKYDKYEVSETSKFYEEVFRDQQVRFLYHTAEQLRFLDDNKEILADSRVQFRHKTRNLVGGNHPDSSIYYLQNPASSVNTVNDVGGYFWWGAGFNLSANKNGCFAYRAHGRVYYFDISFYDLEYDPDEKY